MKGGGMESKLGAYELLEEIGKGGMATVYRAYQTTMDRDVAIKVIRSSIVNDSNALERFQQEAKVIARLEHPHILPVYDFDGRHEPPYIVMRYLDGGTLKDVMKQGLLPLQEVTHVFQQIAAALDYAHRQGIVHRDIKPSNIMIDREGNAFVSDLGIARITGNLASERRGITASGAIVGTPEYMSPEQALGRSDVNYQADIYSLGVMLFEMLTGQIPFDGDSAMAILLKHVQSPIPSARELNSELPDSLEYVIERAMAKEADARYNSAGQMAHEMLQITGSVSGDGLVQLRQAATSTVSTRTQRPIHLSDAKASSDASTGSRETPGEQQRQLTVVHVNLADFEEILLEINSEEASKHLAALMSRIQPLIKQNGGVIREQSEIVLQALWGVHEVREDDPEVAILTALKIRDIARDFSHRWLEEGEAMPIQIGIDTGLILVRRDDDGTMSSSGQAINYAVRIERAAPHGTIMISSDTFRHVIGVFNVAQETPVRVRGRSEPIEVYVVLEARPRAFRLQTRGVEGIETKMIGRDSELKLLQDAFRLCIEDRETQMVTVTAEAGVGKSRLLYEFSRWIDVIEETITFFEARATQQTTNLPYALIRNLLSFRFEILDSDSIPVMREKMFEGIARFMGADSEDASAFIGQLVGFDFDDHPAVQPILSNVDAFQQRALAHLNAFFKSIATAPALMELEDIHWADHQSLDLLNQLVSENRELPLMIICMARPQLVERRPGWGEGQDFHHRLDLKPLSKLDSRRLLREVLQLVDDIPTELRDLIIERADGNPFYVEELVKILIEDGVIVKNSADNARWAVKAERLKDLRVPPTLTGVLQARLDTLDPQARLLLGRASVIGRIFWASALDYLQKADGFHIHKAEALLEDLRQREMIFLREKSDFGGTHEYVIKHAILRDVIYESLLKRQQREYHKAAAEWLIEISAERADEYTGLIAEHYELAGEAVKAASYLLTAGKKANRVAALNEAEILLNHALSILPEDENDETKQMRVYINIEQVDTFYRRWQLEEVDKLGHEVLKLARELDDHQSLAHILAHLALNVSRRGDYEGSVKYALEADQLFDHISDKRIQLFVLRQIGNAYTTRAKTVRKGLEYFERSHAIASEIHDIFGQASACNAIGNAYLVLNQLSTAVEYHEKAASFAREVKDASQLSVALMNVGLDYFYAENYLKAQSIYQEVFALREQIGADQATTHSQMAVVLLHLGSKDEDVLQHLNPVLLRGIETNDFIAIQESLETLAELLVRRGDYERGAETIGLWYTGPTYDPDDVLGQMHINKALDTIAQALPAEVIAAAIERGKAMDLLETAKALYAEFSS
jgi:serine/threonine protein kinase/predicted ATPase